MAKRSKKTTRKKVRKRPLRRRILRWLTLGAVGAAAFVCLVVLAGRIINPPTTIFMVQESRRLGGIERQWAPIEQIAPVMARSVVAAEAANFCLHWGFDLDAIRQAIEAGANRGASTLTQQTVKNVYLWHGRSWLRKALETGLTLLVEALWPKERILEIYLNIAEFDEGVFGVEAAAQAAFGLSAKDLTATQAARLAAVLPNPKARSAAKPSARLRQRAAAIADGAATIAKDERAACFDS
ncbi:MAG: monofunctional biosynthetic peptidoglycan transglycosylase [Rhodobacteraceae bacterium]|nr:monofunctional biosynthetic peptidoglycan transglycosylase [Paracoccaceae bacterium]